MAPKKAQMFKRPAAQVLKRPAERDASKTGASASNLLGSSPSGSASHGSDRVAAPDTPGGTRGSGSNAQGSARHRAKNPRRDASRTDEPASKKPCNSLSGGALQGSDRAAAPAVPGGARGSRSNARGNPLDRAEESNRTRQLSHSPRGPYKVKHAKITHPAAAGGLCWSCKAGGMEDSCSNAIRYKRNCCKACFNSRRCSHCAEFNTALDAVWCVKCELRVAMCCRTCNDDDTLKQGLCLKCVATKRKREVRAAAAEHTPKLAKHTCAICGPSKPATRKQTAFGEPLCRTCLRDLDWDAWWASEQSSHKTEEAPRHRCFSCFSHSPALDVVLCQASSACE